MTEGVGPVLSARAPESAAVLAAIRAHNDPVAVIDRGSYLRVQVPGRCVLLQSTVETELGRPFRLPADLERIMPSFAGFLSITTSQAIWSAERERG